MFAVLICLQFSSLFSFRLNFTCLCLVLDVVLQYLSMFLLQLQDTGPECGSVNVKRFLIAMDEMGLPSFELSDIEQVSIELKV